MAPPRLLLASTSPRRAGLLQAAGIAFELVAPGPEPAAGGAPAERAILRARSKAAHANVPAGCLLPVLGVDTVVDVDGIELGKPEDRADAAAMLARLSGRLHRVHTAHCLIDPRSGRCRELLASAEVRCAALTGAQLKRYLDANDWRGKAGAYGIQDPTQDFMALASGDFDTVVGISLAAVVRLLAAAP